MECIWLPGLGKDIARDDLGALSSRMWMWSGKVGDLKVDSIEIKPDVQILYWMRASPFLVCLTFLTQTKREREE